MGAPGPPLPRGAPAYAGGPPQEARHRRPAKGMARATSRGPVHLFNRAFLAEFGASSRATEGDPITVGSDRLA